MILSAAPIIHARTSDVDFRSSLLVVPAAFGPDDVQWARKYILASTRCFELAGETGRRVVFSNKDVVVSGLSIRIRDLYQLCGKEPKYHLVDRGRTNYAFIGFVISRECITDTFDVPYSMLLDQFEAYMALRWNDSLDNPGAHMSTKVNYADIEFPKADAVSDVLSFSGPLPRAIDINADSINSLCAQAAIIAAKQPGFGFCSDIPMAKCVLESNFHIVTSTAAASINESLQSKQPSDHIRMVSSNTTKASARSAYNAAPDEDLNKQKEYAKTSVFKKVGLGIIIAVCIITVIVLLLS